MTYDHTILTLRAHMQHDTSYFEALGTQAYLVCLDKLSTLLLAMVHNTFVTHFACVWAGATDLALRFGLLFGDDR